MNLKPAIDLARYPSTHDKDRYARNVRIAIREALEGAPAGPLLVLQGLLRLTDRRDSIENNRLRLSTGLDIITTLTGVAWRGDVKVVIDGEEYTRRVAQISNPAFGQELVDGGIITGYDPDTCTCEVNPHQFCFAAVHTI